MSGTIIERHQKVIERLQKKYGMSYEQFEIYLAARSAALVKSPSPTLNAALMDEEEDAFDRKVAREMLIKWLGLQTEQFSATQFAIKVRADLKSGDVLQVRLYCNESHIDYAYQLIRRDAPLVRWDNKEYFPTLATYPHHFRSLSGQVLASDLTGLPDEDLPAVLRKIEILFP